MKVAIGVDAITLLALLDEYFSLALWILSFNIVFC